MNRLGLLLGVLGLGTGCTVEPDDAPYRSTLTAACNDCLSGTGDAALHCGSELGVCDDDPACEDYVLCQLRFDCYAAPATGSCERRAGCAAPPVLDAALAFETCARTTCAGACQFAAPP